MERERVFQIMSNLSNVLNGIDFNCFSVPACEWLDQSHVPAGVSSSSLGVSRVSIVEDNVGIDGIFPQDSPVSPVSSH